MWFGSSFSSLFCSVVLLITEGGMFISPSRIVNLPISPYSSISLCFVYFEARLLGVCTSKTVTSSWWIELCYQDSDAGRGWGQEEKGTTEDEMAGWHHRLDGCESEWTPGVGDGQGGLACCYSWGRKESDTTEWLNWTDCYKAPPLYP